MSEDCAQRNDLQAQATGSHTEPEVQATGSPTEPETQATGSPTEPEAQATESHTEPEANAADSESQTSAIDFEENDSEDEANSDNQPITGKATHNKNSQHPQYFEVYLHGKKLRRVAVLSMVALAVVVLGTAFAILWTTLLTCESITCGEVGFDCSANGKQVTNCSMFENGTIVYINGTRYYLECYRFVFDYVGGLSAAGGYTFSAKIVINLLLLAVSKICEIKSSRRRRLSMALFSLFLSIISLVVVLIYSLSVFEPLHVPPKFVLRYAYSFSLLIGSFAYTFFVLSSIQ